MTETAVKMSGKLPRSLPVVGAGGIGMSGLAQMARALGCRVTGSDRALNNPENAALFAASSSSAAR